MTTTPIATTLGPRRISGLRTSLQKAWSFSPILTLAALIHLALIPLFALAAIADPRVITGAPAWVKPLKFAISIPIYTITILWMLTLVAGRRRFRRLVAGVTGLGLTIETALIAMQVLRGATSHFNVATPFDSAVFSAMGTIIILIALGNLLLAIWLIYTPVALRKKWFAIRL